MASPVKHRGKWRIRWLDAASVRHSAVYITFAEAKAELALRESAAEEERRGLRQPAPADRTFDDLADYWVQNRVPQKRSGKDDLSILRRYLRPALGGLRLRDVGVQHADRLLAGPLAQLNRKTANNILTLLISMLNAALDLEWITRLPRIRKPKVRIFSRDYSWLRTDEEVTRFLAAARCEGEVAHMLYAVAVYTGMRAGELAALRWSDIDFERRLITVQRSFEGPTKADDVRYVPILDVLLSELKAWRLRCPGDLLFPNQDGGMQCASARIFQEVLHRVLDAAGFEQIVRHGKPGPYIVFHSLRHTFASHWVAKGGDLFRLQKILGHKSIQMTQRYAHLAPAVFAEDWHRFGAGRGGDVAAVIELRR